jgi:MFS family permease
MPPTEIATVARRAAPVVAGAALVVTVAAAIAAIASRIVDPAPILQNNLGFGDVALIGFGLMAVAYSAVGALIMVRRPGNAVGWLMLVIGLCHGVGASAGAVTTSAVAYGTPDALVTARLAGWVTMLFVTIGGFALGIGFIFPTGRGHTRGWDHLFRGLMVAGVVVSALMVLQPGPLIVFPTLANPLGIGPDLRPFVSPWVPLIAAVAGVLIPLLQTWSLASRYRVSGEVERQQIKWFASAIVLSVGGFGLALIWASITDDPPEIGLATFGFAGALVPIAIGIAITRYHLYDIDRIISRTISYAVITALLGATFAGLVLGITTAFGSVTESNTIAVAAATLAVFALFQPVRLTVQRSVDRRFNRQRIDAEQATAAFATRLRDELDLGTLVDELARAGRSAAEPSSTSIWLRRP